MVIMKILIHESTRVGLSIGFEVGVCPTFKAAVTNAGAINWREKKQQIEGELSGYKFQSRR